MIDIWNLYDRQKDAMKLIESNKFTLLIGQGRASKTTLAVYYLFARAIKYSNTTHVIFRNTLSSAVDGIWKQTIKEVIEHFFPPLTMIDKFKVNESDHCLTFPNGSRILLRGLDTPDRATKVLSQQFATVLFDESQTIDYTYFSLLLTRVPQPRHCRYKVKVICTANYAPRTHWTKTFFQDKLNPETKVAHELQVDFLKFTTDDNHSIDAEEYLTTLKTAGDRRAKRMCAGTDWFEDVYGALWVDDDIQRCKKCELNEYDLIVIAFDPAISNTNTSDEHGVCIAGKIDNQYHIIEAFEKKEDVNVMAQQIAKLYHSYQCYDLIYETNQGKDWIEALITNHDPSVYCVGVRAKKGKLLRAEPVAALYKNNLVYHTKEFPELEDQMVTYTGSGDSPNALDALVYAVQHLSTSNKYIDLDKI